MLGCEAGSHRTAALPVISPIAVRLSLCVLHGRGPVKPAILPLTILLYLGAVSLSWAEPTACRIHLDGPINLLKAFTDQQ